MKNGKIKENNREEKNHINENLKKQPTPELLKQNSFLINNFKSHYALSKPGRDEYGNSKINQDTYIILTNINGIKDFNIFGVLDGHGAEGQLVSQFVSKYLQVEFQTHSLIGNLKTSDAIYTRLCHKDFDIIKDIFISADQALRDQDIDSKNSGTTCVLVIQIGEHIICANVGDSRAVLVFDEKNDSNLDYIKVFPLSVDNKPERTEERERIIKMGGTVEKIFDKYGKGVGVISDPEIIECNLSIYTKYIVI